jgi:superfamily II DNA or RNA helicase
MSHVVIEKISEVHLKISGSSDAEQEIKDYFTFKAPGYKYHPRFKARMWNGDMSLLDMRTKRLPAGNITRLLDFLKDEDIEVRFVENELHGLPTSIDDEITREEIKEFCLSLKPWSFKQLEETGNGYLEIYEYQIDAIYESLRNRRLTLISPTASGKSLILYCIIRWFLHKDSTFRIILTVPNIGLVNQMFADFDEYSHKNGWRVEDLAQKLFTGQSKELTKQILITTWQSLKNVIPKSGGSKVLNTYDAVLVDEAHSAKGKELQILLAAMTLIPYRIGTTGTQTDPVNQLLIEGMLGPIYRVVTTKELMDGGKVSQMKIQAVVLRYTAEERKLVSQKTKKKASYEYPQEQEFIHTHTKRNRFVRNIALACEGVTLVLFKSKDHGKLLFNTIKERATKPIYYVDGDVDGMVRENMRQHINKTHEDCILVCSYGTFSTGINIPSIRNIIFAGTSRSSIRVLQSIGRGLRLYKDKMLTLIDLVDDIKYLSKKNFALNHFEERLKIYQREQFTIKIKEVQL